MSEAVTTFEPDARDVHVEVTSSDVCAFVQSDATSLVCFRCGEAGHMRMNCLTYKVRLCWHYENGACHDARCTFAHGKEELRTPWKQRCVRVVKHEGHLVCIGCNSRDHTFRKCPLHQDLLQV